MLNSEVHYFLYFQFNVMKIRWLLESISMNDIWGNFYLKVFGVRCRLLSAASLNCWLPSTTANPPPSPRHPLPHKKFLVNLSMNTFRYS